MNLEETESVKGKGLQPKNCSLGMDSIGRTDLTGRSGQSRRLRHATRSCNVCGVDTLNLRISKHISLCESKKSVYHGLCMLSKQSL